MKWLRFLNAELSNVDLQLLIFIVQHEMAHESAALDEYELSVTEARRVGLEQSVDLLTQTKPIIRRYTLERIRSEQNGDPTVTLLLETEPAHWRVFTEPIFEGFDRLSRLTSQM